MSKIESKEINTVKAIDKKTGFDSKTGLAKKTGLGRKVENDKKIRLSTKPGTAKVEENAVLNEIKAAVQIQRPTDSELEILKIIWDSEEATVRHVHEKIALHKNVGYTTTLKLMQIMHEKGILKRNTDTRTHVYSAAISKDKTLKQLVSKLIDSAFDGSAFELVSYVLEHKKIGKKEAENLKKYFKSSEKKGK